MLIHDKDLNGTLINRSKQTRGGNLHAQTHENSSLYTQDAFLFFSLKITYLRILCMEELGNEMRNA